jgi:hypothetical protein
MDEEFLKTGHEQRAVIVPSNLVKSTSPDESMAPAARKICGNPM